MESSRGPDDQIKHDGVFNIIPENFRVPHVWIAEVLLSIDVIFKLPQSLGANSSKVDIFEWLQKTFRFQVDNARNQREHLVLLFANRQMTSHDSDKSLNEINPRVVHEVCDALTKNYDLWCEFHQKRNYKLVGAQEDKTSMEIIYAALYLLIWGEAANVRFMPECLCYIFHHMAGEVNQLVNNNPILNGYYVDSQSTSFLDSVIMPFYTILKEEAAAGSHGKNPHSVWRNYCDMNEYFWSKECFQKIKWPIDKSAGYFTSPGKSGRVGKTGFVEQRSFFNLFRSFDRVWVMHILMFQALLLIALDAGSKAPWNQLIDSQDTVAVLLSCFVTWAFIRFLIAIINVIFDWRLSFRHRGMSGLRMVLKVLMGTVWTLLLSILYRSMWLRRQEDTYWSSSAQVQFRTMLVACGVFCIPQVLGLLLFIFPWLGRSIERCNWRIVRASMWWFHRGCFVGRGLYESTLNSFMYTLFWLVLLSGKFLFSYFLQIKPLVEPTRLLLELDVKYKFPKIDSGHNLVGVVCLWAPVVLVYFLDLQIWYTVLSAVVGLIVGLGQHLGEVRNLEFLWLKFTALPMALQFNLISSSSSSVKRGFFGGWKDYFTKMRIRYNRLMQPKVEGPHSTFVVLWNSVMEKLREEDLISHKELATLRAPTSTWHFSVPLWPAVQLSNGVTIAMKKVQDRKSHSAEHLIKRISKNEYRLCAVVESYETLKHLLFHIIQDTAAEVGMLEKIFETIEACVDPTKNQALYETLNLKCLPAVHKRVVALVKLLSGTGSDSLAVVKALQDLAEDVFKDFFWKDGKDLLTAFRVIPNEQTTQRHLFDQVVQMSATTDAVFQWHAQRLLTLLTTESPIVDVPANLEAKRRILFFSNSVFMNIPRAPTVKRMRAFSILTPYYAEKVTFSRKELVEKNEDGISILFYLQKVFPDEWLHLKERLQAQTSNIKGNGDEVCNWASLRGQTLMRTVRGMMYNRTALEILAKLEGDAADSSSTASHGSTASSVRGLNGGGVPADVEMQPLRSPGAGGRLSEAHTAALCDVKFTYVVACQLYGKQKKEKAASAAAVLELMRQHPALRVAFVDEDDHGRFHSVLSKWDPVRQEEQEIYRIQLPGPIKLGEGKPENQNHAIIFTRGEALQTIDMNQDFYLEEALKMRNLLQEFDVTRGAHRRRILGVREHVFTGGVSSLATFMSAQETAFVTMGQRVLACPLKVRMHYGHPDIFDRLWFLTRGGVSKASSVINLSEDIYAGFNCTLRGGTVSHHEYLQVGKGRDVGLSQIALFEAKVASGNGEQALSRDVYRLGHRLDFFRMLSFYYTSVGFFANTMLTALTVYAFLYGRCYLALSGVEATLDLRSNVFTAAALTAVLNQQFLVQLGVLTALPMVLEATLEHGFLAAAWDFVLMQLQLASVFFTFSLGTRTHYFGRTILHGGAKYRATGRGFVVGHEKFAQDYRTYARSHFVKGFELMVLLIVYQTYTSLSSGVGYYLLTLSSWFLALSWTMAPFIFNPSGFDWLKMVDDWKEFYGWLWHPAGTFTTEEQSWEVWWHSEISHLRTTGLWGLLGESVLSLRFFLYQWAIIYQLDISGGNTSVLVYVYSWGGFVFILVLSTVLALLKTRFYVKDQLKYRTMQLSSFVLALVFIIVGLLLTSFTLFDVLASIVAFLPTGWGLLQLMQVFWAAVPGLADTPLWSGVVQAARLYELILAIAVVLPVAILSWLPGVQDMQTRIMFNSAFSRGLQISKLLVGGN